VGHVGIAETRFLTLWTDDLWARAFLRVRAGNGVSSLLRPAEMVSRRKWCQFIITPGAETVSVRFYASGISSQRP
jgi:hypothetical protein